MRTHSASIAALLLLLAAPVGAATIEIPLPEVTGTYPYYVGSTYHSERIATFHLPGLPMVIRGASLRLRGSAEVGVLHCEGHPDVPWGIHSEGSMRAGPLQLWISETFNEVAGAFETNTPFVFLAFSHEPPSWAFLDDGEDTISLTGYPRGTIPECGGFPEPTVTVTEATLIFDADIPVPTRAQTWGRIKALYR